MSVVQPISAQLANYNLEHIAQTSRDGLAQATQTSQMQDMVKKNEKRAQEIQPSDEVESSEKIHRKTDDEHRQERQKQEDGEKKDDDSGDAPAWGTPVKKDGRYDFYV